MLRKAKRQASSRGQRASAGRGLGSKQPTIRGAGLLGAKRDGDFEFLSSKIPPLYRRYLCGKKIQLSTRVQSSFSGFLL